MEDFLTQAIENMRRTEVSTTFSNLRQRMRHAMIGLADEAGELTKLMLRADFYNKTVDPTEYKDELGDILWYLCLAIDDLAEFEEVSPEVIAAEILTINKAKLLTRYPEKYSHQQARERDVEKEQEAIKDMVNHKQ